MRDRRSIHKWLLAAVGIVCALSLLGVTGRRLQRVQQTKVLEPKEGLVCLLVNKHSGRCLSVASQAENVGSMVVQGPTPDQAGARERWTLLAAGSSFRLLNESNHLVVEIWDARPEAGVGALQADDHVTMPHQHWAFEAFGDYYVLRAAHSKLVLAVSQSSQKEGAPLVQWTHAPGHGDQLWEMRPVKETAAEPRTVRNGSALIVVGLGIAFLVGIWLLRRHHRRAGKTPARAPVPDTEANPRSAPPVVSFACADCGKKLKARGELAGKKVKCTQCGKAVLVPRIEEDAPGRFSS